jgi:hypothetical protein
MGIGLVWELAGRCLQNDTVYMNYETEHQYLICGDSIMWNLQLQASHVMP